MELCDQLGLSSSTPAGMRFTPRRDLEAEPLPGVMLKVIAHAFDPKPEAVKAPRGRRKREAGSTPLLTMEPA